MRGRASALALLPAGFVFGVISGFLTQQQVELAGVAVPWGPILGAAALIATVRALCHGYGSRTAGAAYYIGWLVATVLLVVPNPSGDVVFPASAAGYGYLLAATVLGAAAAAWPIALPTPASAPEDPPHE